MLTRRNFLALTGGAAGLMALGDRALAASPQPIGLQLYTVRAQAEKDLPKTLAEVRQAGYDEVELYWDVYSHPAAELTRMLKDEGLKAPSGHFNYDGIESKIEYAKQLGLQYVICPMLPPNMWNSAAEFKRAGERFNQIGERVKQAGMTFGFHNHNYEFRRFGKQTGLEILMGSSDPNLVKLEMDCYWVTQAGSDPLVLFKQYGQRIRMLHLKDRKAGFPPSQTLNAAAGHFAEFGTGSIRWAPILAKAKELGVQHYFIEQDVIQGDPVASIRTSYQNARKMLT